MASLVDTNKADGDSQEGEEIKEVGKEANAAVEATTKRLELVNKRRSVIAVCLPDHGLGWRGVALKLGSADRTACGRPNWKLFEGRARARCLLLAEAEDFVRMSIIKWERLPMLSRYTAFVCESNREARAPDVAADLACMDALAAGSGRAWLCSVAQRTFGTQRVTITLFESGHPFSLYSSLSY